MNQQACSAIASLVFETRPVLNFAACVAEFDIALRDGNPERYALSWDYDDLVIFDIDGSRVVLAYGDRFDAEAAPDRETPTSCAACLMISIGSGQIAGGSTMIADHRSKLLRVIVDRLQTQYRADLVLWSELDRGFTPDDFDAFLCQTISACHSARAQAPETRSGYPNAAGSDRFAAPEVERLMQRLENQIAHSPAPAPVSVTKGALARPELAQTMAPADGSTRSAGPDSPAPAAAPTEPPAITLPEAPHPAQLEMARIRKALYPGLASGSSSGGTTLPLRLTIYTLNTTLMLVALPVGSAILAYNVIAGENLAMSARAIAVSGTLIGLAQTPICQSLLAFV